MESTSRPMQVGRRGSVAGALGGLTVYLNGTGRRPRTRGSPTAKVSGVRSESLPQFQLASPRYRSRRIRGALAGSSFNPSCFSIPVKMEGAASSSCGATGGSDSPRSRWKMGWSPAPKFRWISNLPQSRPVDDRAVYDEVQQFRKLIEICPRPSMSCSALASHHGSTGILRRIVPKVMERSFLLKRRQPGPLFATSEHTRHLSGLA